MCLNILFNTFGILGGLYSFYNYINLKQKIEDFEQALNEIIVEVDELNKQMNKISSSNIIIIE